MLIDFAESLLGLLLGPLVFILPGYAIGHGSMVFDFRRRSARVRVAIAVMLSVAVGPITLYALLQLGWWAVWLVYGLVWAICVGVLARNVGTLGGTVRTGLVGLVIAVIIVLLQIDIGWGDHLYFSTAARDFVRSIAITSEVRAHALPPINPMFFDGESVPLFYYYGWMLMTGFLDILGGEILGPRGAVFAGTSFCALALIGTVATFVATSPNPLSRLSPLSHSARRMRTAGLLLLVGGLDVIVFLAGAFVLKMAGRPVVITDMEWWNEPVIMWITSVLTVPHHVGGLIAGLAACRLARFSCETDGRQRSWALILSAAGFASSVLCSIWIAVAMVLVGMVWVVINIIGKQWEEVRGWVASGVLAGLFSLPFLFYLKSVGSVEGSPIKLGIRPFGPLETFFGVARVGLESVIHLPFLPLSYALEFGFFALAGILFWRLRKRDPHPQSQNERLLAVILAVGLLLPTLAYSAVRNNDLGVRVPMLAQFVLVLWSADLLSALRSGAVSLSLRWLRPALISLMLIGVVSSISNMFVTRFATPAADAGLIAMPGMYGEDRELGLRTKDLRDAYDWLRARTPENAVVQHNPRHGIVRREGGFSFAPALYGQRHSVAFDDDMGTMYAISRERYDPIARDVASAFDQPNVANAAAVAARRHIDVFVVSDRDGIWRDTTSWVWSRRADYSNSRVRVFLDPAQTFVDSH